MEQLNSKKALFAVAFYALNPLIIVESIISSHLDSLMLIFLLVGFYYFIKSKRFVGIIGIIASAGIKFLTGVLLPLFFIFPSKKAQQMIDVSFWVFLIAL